MKNIFIRQSNQFGVIQLYPETWLEGFGRMRVGVWLGDPADFHRVQGYPFDRKSVDCEI